MTAPETFELPRKSRDADLARQRAAGVTAIFQRFDWAAIEAVRGRYDLAATDAVVTAAARAGIVIVPVVSGAPRFHRLEGGAGRAALRRLAAHLEARYGPAGSLWRESPELRAMPVTTWQMADPPRLSARAYARALAAVRSGLGRGSVIAGATSPSRLKALYAAPGAATWDAVGVAAWARDPGDVVARLQAVRRAMTAAGDSAGGLWLTGTGWSASGPRSLLRVGERGQAQRIRTLFAELRRRPGLKLRGLVYQGWRDPRRPAPGAGPDGEPTGLVAARGDAKPALAAFAAAAQQDS